MAIRRKYPNKRPATAYQPVAASSRALGHVICSSVYRSGCDCEKRGQPPCIEMQRSADEVERFISDRPAKVSPQVA